MKGYFSMQIRNCKASRRVKLSVNKFVSFSAEGKFSVEINTERLHTVPADTVSSVCISCFLVHIYLAGTCYLGLEINGCKPNIYIQHLKLNFIRVKKHVHVHEANYLTRILN